MRQRKHDQSPEIVNDIFTGNNTGVEFRKNRDFMIPSVNTVFHGI